MQISKISIDPGMGETIIQGNEEGTMTKDKLIGVLSSTEKEFGKYRILLEELSIKICDIELFTIEDLETYIKLYNSIDGNVDLINPFELIKKKVISILEKGEYGELEQFSRFGYGIKMDNETMIIVECFRRCNDKVLANNSGVIGGRMQYIIFNKTTKQAYDTEGYGIVNKSHFYGQVKDKGKLKFVIINLSNGNKSISFVVSPGERIHCDRIHVGSQVLGKGNYDLTDKNGKELGEILLINMGVSSYYMVFDPLSDSFITDKISLEGVKYDPDCENFVAKYRRPGEQRHEIVKIIKEKFQEIGYK